MSLKTGIARSHDSFVDTRSETNPLDPSIYTFPKVETDKKKTKRLAPFPISLLFPSIRIRLLKTRRPGTHYQSCYSSPSNSNSSPNSFSR